MQRTRTFSFTIHSKNAVTAWTYLCTINNYDYMCMNIKKNKIQGYIRFKHAKKIETVQELLQFDAVVKEESRCDNDIRKELYYKDKFYENGTPKNNRGKSTETNKELLSLITQLCASNQTNNSATTNATNNSATTNANSFTNNNITNNNITNNNVTINNKVSFNLNMFLNNKCKDAMDITAFMRSIPIGLDEVMLFNRMGHAEAITRIIDKAYREIDLTMRPMHCTDVKRETLYVRSDNKWTNDESRAIIEQAINAVANRSFSNLKIWKDANPGYNEDEDKKTEYARIMRQMLGGLSDREIEENKSKIVRNVTRLAQLDKEQASNC
jgi:hypothetical protein